MKLKIGTVKLYNLLNLEQHYSTDFNIQYIIFVFVFCFFNLQHKI